MNVFQDEMVDVTNNLANARTVGFKAGRTEKESLFTIERTFQQELRDQMISQGMTPAYGPIEYGTGVRVVSTPKDFTQGTLETTNSPLDIAIQGEGFFKYTLADGTYAYGRAGSLHVDDQGNITDPNGYILQPQITVPEGTTKILIRQDGTVSVSINNSIQTEDIGQISVTRFMNPAGLKSVGQNLFTETDSSGTPVDGVANQEGYGAISQYSLEGSNVDVISEMMRMVIIQRVFDTVTKAVQSYDGMLTSIERMKS